MLYVLLVSFPGASFSTAAELYSCWFSIHVLAPTLLLWKSSAPAGLPPSTLAFKGHFTPQQHLLYTFSSDPSESNGLPNPAPVNIWGLMIPCRGGHLHAAPTAGLGSMHEPPPHFPCIQISTEPWKSVHVFTCPLTASGCTNPMQWNWLSIYFLAENKVQNPACVCVCMRGRWRENMPNFHSQGFRNKVLEVS